MEPGRSAYNHPNIENFLAYISLFRQQTLDSVDQPAQTCTADLRIACSLIIKQKTGVLIIIIIIIIMMKKKC